ncbi:polysaccharide deacetylase family protein [Actinacidiphila acidipaludis]|uniref:Polysaccharide deacetylase family protein n=1 Tax=Actinacidiphila acidipaludis TaxID=2873382 RepID=A0ABS7Q972_9ACTN|nr:polysaccharide deacetylase family protein [Streptomyces acidipaludis]MBY8879701.1 polysaccharide deacetylase family protein [Streptomyces acidipaludis]
MSDAGGAARGAGAVLAALPVLGAAAHIVPAGAWLDGPRRALMPSLAGLGDPHHVALTFDDGPDPASTPAFLDALEGLGVRATFFVLGERLARHRALGAEIAARGHELGTHGWTHGRPWWPDPRGEIRGLRRAAHGVREAAGTSAVWYRPPYGVLTGDRLLAARRCGLRPVLWSVWGRDWTADATAASVLHTVGRGLTGGATVLLHDSDRHSAPGCWRATLGALPALVARCRERGWAVGPLGEHGVRPAR